MSTKFALNHHVNMCTSNMLVKRFIDYNCSYQNLMLYCTIFCEKDLHRLPKLYIIK